MRGLCFADLREIEELLLRSTKGCEIGGWELLEAERVEGGFEVLEGESELQDEDVVDLRGGGLAAGEGVRGGEREGEEEEGEDGRED